MEKGPGTACRDPGALTPTYVVWSARSAAFDVLVLE